LTRQNKCRSTKGEMERPKQDRTTQKLAYTVVLLLLLMMMIMMLTIILLVMKTINIERNGRVMRQERDITEMENELW